MRDPWVGRALDPDWRMGPRAVFALRPRVRLVSFG